VSPTERRAIDDESSDLRFSERPSAFYDEDLDEKCGACRFSKSLIALRLDDVRDNTTQRASRSLIHLLGKRSINYRTWRRLNAAARVALNLSRDTAHFSKARGKISARDGIVETVKLNPRLGL